MNGSSRRRRAQVLVVGLGVVYSSAAFADIEQCVESHSQGQVLRDEGKLLQARAAFLGCASDADCPGPIKDECQQLLENVQRLTPTVTFAARDDLGRDIPGVRIYMDETIVEWASGEAPLAIDPGRHRFRFEGANGQLVELELDAVQGEQARLVIAEFSRAEVLESRPRRPSPPTDGASAADLRRLMTYGFAGLAVVGLASFAVLGLQGSAEESDLRATCAPDCTSAQKQSVAQKYLWADVSLAVAGLSLAGGAVLYFAPLSGDDTAASVSFSGEF